MASILKTQNSSAIARICCALAAGPRSAVTGVYIVPMCHCECCREPKNSSSIQAGSNQCQAAESDSVENEFSQIVAGEAAGIDLRWVSRPSTFCGDTVAHFEQALMSDVVVTDTASLLSDNGRLFRCLLVRAQARVLSIPVDCTTATIGQKVCIAWNGSPDCARAVRASLPLLSKAKSIEIVSVHNATDEIQLPGAELAHYLGDHGLSATLDILRGSPNDTADHVRAHMISHGCDLLVIGCGQTGNGERFSGGITEDLVRNSTVPVFLAK